jgi:hypothetical protein
VTLLYNAQRLGLEVLAAALEPPDPIDLLAWAEENVVGAGELSLCAPDGKQRVSLEQDEALAAHAVDGGCP